MPKILELRPFGSEIWARIGKPGDFPSGVSLWTPEEAAANYQSGYRDGTRDAIDQPAGGRQ